MTDCPESCRRTLVDGISAKGIEVHASTLPPIVESPYDQRPFTCPHGVKFYMAPTSEQIAQWVKDGVR